MPFASAVEDPATSWARERTSVALAQCVDAFCDRGALFAESQVRTGPHVVKARWIPGLHV
ncbi:hypothetical protein AAW14_23230 [Streptomyces hygroscopicus]|nr:hypothetical protein [Streptomyces hygroscopicus]